MREKRTGYIHSEEITQNSEAIIIVAVLLFVDSWYSF